MRMPALFQFLSKISQGRRRHLKCGRRQERAHSKTMEMTDNKKFRPQITQKLEKSAENRPPGSLGCKYRPGSYLKLIVGAKE